LSEAAASISVELPLQLSSTVELAQSSGAPGLIAAFESLQSVLAET